MHLYGEVLTGVDEFYEEWKLIAELLVDLLAYQQFLVLVDELYQRQSLIDIIHQSAIDGHALMAWHTADLPTLADIGLGIEDPFERCDLITAPDGGLQIRFEFIWFHKPSVIDIIAACSWRSAS